MEKEKENKFEEDIRFIVRHYDPDKLDTAEAWKTFSARKGIRKSFPFAQWIIVAAAAILLLVGFRFWHVWELKQPEWVTISADETMRKDVILPDQTSLTLSAGSQIRYDAKQFFKEKREVYLTGKAWFDVYRNPENLFIVNTPLSQVVVLGTGFELSDDGETVSIYVVSGKVSLWVDEGKESAILTKGMSAAYTIGDKMIVTENSEQVNRISWKSGELVFHNTPLKQVVQDLENHYNVQIANLPADMNLELNASFRDMTLEEVLLIINQTLDIGLQPKTN